MSALETRPVYVPPRSQSVSPGLTAEGWLRAVWRLHGFERVPVPAPCSSSRSSPRRSRSRGGIRGGGGPREEGDDGGSGGDPCHPGGWKRNSLQTTGLMHQKGTGADLSPTLSLRTGSCSTLPPSRNSAMLLVTVHDNTTWEFYGGFSGSGVSRERAPLRFASRAGAARRSRTTSADGDPSRSRWKAPGSAGHGSAFSSCVTASRS